MTTLNIALAVAGILSWTLWAIMNRRKTMWAIAPITVFLHVLVFYVVRLSLDAPDVPRETRDFLNAWSTALRFHELILLTGMGVALAWERVERWITRRSFLRR